MDSDEAAGSPNAADASNYKRAPLWGSLLDTIKYLNDARRDKTIVIRDQDRVSIHLLRLALLFAVIFVVTPLIDPELRSITFASTVFADLLFCAALVWFVIRRFGVLRSMTKRHALICCQLMIGSGLLVSLLALNFAVILIMACMGDKIPSLFS